MNGLEQVIRCSVVTVATLLLPALIAACGIDSGTGATQQHRERKDSRHVDDGDDSDVDPDMDGGDDSDAEGATSGGRPSKQQADAGTGKTGAAVEHEDAAQDNALSAAGQTKEVASGEEEETPESKEKRAMADFVKSIAGEHHSSCHSRQLQTLTISGDDFKLVTMTYLRDDCTNRDSQLVYTGKLIVEKRSPDDATAWLAQLQPEHLSVVMLQQPPAGETHSICGYTQVPGVEIDLSGKVCNGHPVDETRYTILRLEGGKPKIGVLETVEAKRPTTMAGTPGFDPG